MVKKDTIIFGLVILGLVATLLIVILFSPQSSLPDGEYEIELSDEEKKEAGETMNNLANNLDKMYSSTEELQDYEILSEEEWEKKLPKGANYKDTVLSDISRKYVVKAEKCDKKEECRFVCLNECAEKNMDSFGTTSIFGSELEQIGECPCLCVFPTHINHLRIIQAIKYKDVNKCEEITVETYGLAGKHSCYLYLAVLLNDESFCEKIPLDEPLRSNCYFMIATMKEDISLCENVGESEIYEINNLNCKEYVNIKKKYYYAIPE